MSGGCEIPPDVIGPDGAVCRKASPMAHLRSSTILPPPWVVTLAGVGLLGWLLVELKELVVLLVVGYSIAYLIDPLLELLERRGVSRAVGVLLVFVAAAAGCALLFLTAVPTIVREYEKLSLNLPSYVAIARDRFGGLFDLARSWLPAPLQTGVDGDLGAGLPALSGETVQRLVRGISSALLGGYSITLTLLNLTLLPFIVFYLAIAFHRLHRGALDLFPVLQQRRIARVAGEIDRYVSAFVRGQLLVGTILFCLYAVGLGSVGVELWLLLAVISGFGNMIPYIGFLVGIVLASIMALVTFGDFTHLLQVWGIYLVVQALEGTLITPRVLGDKVGLSPLIIILAIFAGGQLFGLLGVFLAVPGAAALRVLAGATHTWLRERG